MYLRGDELLQAKFERRIQGKGRLGRRGVSLQKEAGNPGPFGHSESVRSHGVTAQDLKGGGRRELWEKEGDHHGFNSEGKGPRNEVYGSASLAVYEDRSQSHYCLAGEYPSSSSNPGYVLSSRPPSETLCE